MNATIRKAPSLEEFKTVLKKHSLKATPQRLAVHEAMLTLGHACADMVSDYIRANGKAKVTTASVYNILAQLALLGIYQHRMSSNNKMYFDVNNFKHIHLYDKVNHYFKDVQDDEFIEMIESKLSHKRFKGYKIEGFDMQIICRPTRKKASV
ncbi:MAG: transcriptional repressor [Bacteroidales bacterium]|nr:transcriptional repressor [Bacteroidales bacterium]MCR5244686.1 transcriptional repressor [Bacteroidales bacterium]MDT3356478.1 transcriptional repressor [Bacteroidota bacterium]